MPRFLALILGLCMVLCGCGIRNDDNKNSGNDDGARIEQKLPEVHQYDNGMSMAHYISAPSFDSEDNGVIEITDYDVSYCMTVENTNACFVIGDAKGEYGEVILCELSDYNVAGNEQAGDDGEASFTVKRLENGVLDSGFEEKTLGIKRNPDHRYEVQLQAEEKNLKVTINDVQIGNFDIPGFSLGCVGTYKSRGDSFAYIDDIAVTSGGKPLLQDDFDGHFENHLFEYKYETEATSAFSPCYIKTVQEESGSSQSNNVMRVPSGVVLSEVAAEPAPVFRREFYCEAKELKKAYLYLTGLGSFEAWINGKPVSDSFFDPGKMVYNRYLNYVSYDVTDLIQDQNTLDIALFHGFYDRGSGYPEVAGRWGTKRALKGDLVLVYNDESSEIIPTDDQFKVCTDTRYRFDDIYQGEIIDDRYSDPSDTTIWEDVLVDDVDENLRYIGVETKENEPIRAVETRDYISVTEPAEGHFVYDFGQNFAGTISFNLSDFDADEVKEGQVITFRYGELLNSEAMANADGEVGTVWTRNLFTARATDYYIPGDLQLASGNVTFAHTYHGFRYLEISGLDKAISQENLKAMVLSSDMKETGEFQCSSDTINRFYENSKYSLRSNFMDVPTDCPQRDERLGWTGDAQAASGFGMYQYDSKSFYENYMKVMSENVSSEGAYPDVAPSATWFGGHNCWGDAPIVIAWNLYQQYGDKEALEQQYPGMPDWIDYLVETSDGYLRTSGGYADHLAGQETIETLSDTAWCAHSARLVSKMASVLGRDEDAKKYCDIADSFIEAWQKTYIREDWSPEAGILVAEAESETAYSLGIAFDLFPEDIMDAAKERLKILTEYGGYLFYPGYSGMAYYLPALASGGYSDAAVRVLENTAPGGLAFPLTMGLTTHPEELNCFKYQDENGADYNGMYRVSGSLNHAAYSAVCSFLFTNILGIKTDEERPGFEHFFIEPCVNCGLEYASGSYECSYGTIEVSWNAQEKKLECEVPRGCTCTIILPGNTMEVETGEYSLSWE